MKLTPLARTLIWPPTILIGALMLASAAYASGATYHVLYRFQGGSDGAWPGKLISDADGNLFGVTNYGGGGNCSFSGELGCGTVFRLAPPSTAGGAWAETVLHRFAGGNDGAFPAAIVSDSAGNLYLTGDTQSTDFPTVNAFQPHFGGGRQNAFITKFDATGAIVYSSYLGGSEFDEGLNIAVDSSGNAYVAGETHGSFPTTTRLNWSGGKNFAATLCTSAAVTRATPAR